MKKSVIYIVFFLGMLLIVGSCKKYPEGPKLTLRTVKERLSGNWELTRFEVDGVDSLSKMEYKTFEVGHKFKGKGWRYADFDPIGTVTYSGFIGLFEHKELLAFVEGTNEDDFISKHLFYKYQSVYGEILKTATYKILKLTNKELKIRSYKSAVKPYLIEFKKM